ncbi:MAG TPA: endonuclease/exonuclease/phosphatase family protein [Candidatus Limnocylindrales bacterium]
MSSLAIEVATLNILNLADRWAERLPLILADMAALQPDVIGLQEVVYVMEQDRIIGAAGPRHYRTLRGWAGRPEYGNSLLVADELEAAESDRVDLGHNRAAHRSIVGVDGGPSVTIAVTHLHHVPADVAVRNDQAEALVRWLDAGPKTGGRVVVGDFNAHPGEPAHARMRAAGFRSAYAEANGAEPPVTWPSGLQAPAMDEDGDPRCLDYIWVRGPIAVDSARLVFDRPAADDPGLYPSDHVGVAARIVVGG